MPEHMQKVRPGDPLEIPAQTYNEFIDTAVRAKRQGSHVKVDLSGGPKLDSGQAWVKNNTEADLPRFAVVGLGPPPILPADAPDEFKARPFFAGETPIAEDHAGRFAVLLEPVANGKVGRAVVAGVVPVQLDVVDEDHEFADLADDVTATLQTGGSGAAHILWKEAGTGTKWALVRLAKAGGLPPGGLKHQVLSVIDENETKDWDWPRAHLLPA